MAFETPTTAPRATNSAPATGAAREPKTTLAYANAYIPLDDGTRIKLFSDLTLRLFAERDAENQLIDLIKTGQYTVEQIASLIQFEITLARDPNAPVKIDMSKIKL